MASNCQACGQRIVPYTARYCAHCGARVSEPPRTTIGERMFNVFYAFALTVGVLVLGSVGTCLLFGLAAMR